MIWQCNHKFGGDKKCATPHLDDEEIKSYFLRAVNKLCTEKDEIIAAFAEVKDEMHDTSKLEAVRKDLQQELNVVAGLIEQAVNENARIAQDQKAYREKYRGLESRYESVRHRLAETERKIMEKQAKREMTERFLAALAKQASMVTEFSEDMWFNMTDCMTVYARDDVRVTFKNGAEIRA